MVLANYWTSQAQIGSCRCINSPVIMSTCQTCVPVGIGLIMSALELYGANFLKRETHFFTSTYNFLLKKKKLRKYGSRCLIGFVYLFWKKKLYRVNNYLGLEITHWLFLYNIVYVIGLRLIYNFNLALP